MSQSFGAVSSNLPHVNVSWDNEDFVWIVASSISLIHMLQEGRSFSVRQKSNSCYQSFLLMKILFGTTSAVCCFEENSRTKEADTKLKTQVPELFIE